MPSYDQRLFSGGLRTWFHESRFIWLSKKLSTYASSNPLKIVELGCFNARSINYLPNNFATYHGVDCNWEGGLDQAKSSFCDERISFSYCVEASGLEIAADTNVFISLETLEHLDGQTLKGYIEKIARTLPINSFLFITVPNEVGLIFVVKRILKRFFFQDHVASEYNYMEFIFQAFGKTDKITRNYDHKGFHWKKLLWQLSESFQPVLVEGVQAPKLPIVLNPSIGFVLKKVH